MRGALNKLHTILIVTILLVLALFMLTIGLRFFTNAILVERMQMDNRFTRLVLDPDNKAMRADQADSTPMPEIPPAPPGGWRSRLKNLARPYLNLTRRVINGTNHYVNQDLILRRPIVEAANAYERLIDWNMASYSEYNHVVDMGDGYLTTFMNRVNVKGNVDSVADFKDYLDARGIPMLFVQLPHKVSKQDREFNHVVDFYNANADHLLEGLSAKGVRTLDIRDHAPQDLVGFRALFYNTDHHWRAEAALWAAGLITQQLNERFGFHVDLSLFAPDNYHAELYEQAFLGSLGQKVTLARATPDDFALLYPRFDTDLRFQIPEIDLDDRGPFEIFFDRTPLDGSDPYLRETYGIYLHSVGRQHSFVRITNNLAREDGKKVLVLGDSFCSVLVPYLALGFSHLDLVDLRQYAGSLKDLISAEHYDMVILPYASLYEAEHVTGTSMYDFR